MTLDEPRPDDAAPDSLLDPPPAGFGAEIRDAVSVRTVSLVLGVLLIQLAFIASYVGAFHDPTPHAIPVAVVAPGPTGQQLISQINALTGRPLDATAAATPAEATALVKAGSRSGALIINPSGTSDTLLVASGGGASVVTAVEQVANQLESAQGRSVTVSDVVPLQTGDGRGLTGFYLVLGWLVGGYLVAALLGIAKGARPANTRRAVIRLLAIAPYAVLSGLGGAVIVGPVFGALSGHFWALWGLGVLLVYSAAAVTFAFQILAGVLGIGLTVLLFVVLGNPSAGGAYQAALLPAFWRVLSTVLPNGAGTTAVRDVVYFSSRNVTSPILVITAWLLGGVVVALLASLRLDHHRTTSARSAVIDAST